MVIKRTITFFLTALILFADSGQMIYAHTCLKDNHTTFSLYSPGSCNSKKEIKKGCCAKKESAARNCTLGKMSCCSVSSKYIKQSFPAGEIKLTAKEVVKNVIAKLDPFVAFVFNTLHQLNLYSLPHSPLSKADIHLTQVFRI